MKKSIIILLALLLCFIPLFAKAKAPVKNVRPAWVDNPKAEYPETMYMSAVGEGSNRRDAENTAIGNISRIFESKVKAESSVQERYKELTGNGGSSMESATESNKSVNVSSEQKLINIEIGPSWTDDLGRVYVIAYLHRLKTADIYEEKISDNEKRINQFLQQTPQSENPQYLYANLSAATFIAGLNQELIDQLAVISPDSREMLDLSYNYQSLRQKTAETARQIHFTVSIMDDQKDRITSQIQQVLVEQGFSLNTDNAILVKGQISFEDAKLNQPQKYVRYTLNLDVVDVNGALLFTFNKTGREGHLNYSEAEARAIRTVSQLIQKDFKSQLLNYFDGLAQKNEGK